MSHAARSVYAAGMYVFFMGSGLILIPHIVLSVFNLPPTEDIWIRMLGMMTVFVGIFQLQIARLELPDLFRLTIILRLSVVGFVMAFIAVGLAQPAFLMIAVVDVAGALWTWWALQHVEKPQT